jgi:isopenicillin N synthase-like dioxygenase
MFFIVWLLVLCWVSLAEQSDQLKKPTVSILNVIKSVAMNVKSKFFKKKLTDDATNTIDQEGKCLGSAKEIPLIPVISLSGLFSESREDRMKVALQLRKAAENIGFFIITDHGIDQSILDETWSSTRSFFDKPEEYKKTYAVQAQSEYPFGYVGFGDEILKAGKDVETGDNSSIARPDLKELFSIGPSNPLSGFPGRVWPSEPKSMEISWTKYYENMSNLADTILSGFALSLGLDEAYFKAFVGHHASAIRALNYPEQDGHHTMPGQMRASAHTDYGTITILRSGGPGLQVSKDKEDPDWVDVPDAGDGFIVNLGDLMRRWTNDRWLSTLHRVVNPESGTKWERRQSMAFFHNPNRDALIKPILFGDVKEAPKHEPIVAGDFLMQKHLAATSSS